MSRDSGGTYTLPAGNPVVTGTVISTTWANPTLADVGAALTDSLSRSGLGGMTAPLRTADGTLGAPAWSFTSETGMGWYRSGTNALRLAINGAVPLEIDANGFVFGAGLWQARVKAADQSRSSPAVLAADSDLTGITLQAGRTYRLEAFVSVFSASGTPGFRMAFTYTGTWALASEGMLWTDYRGGGVGSVAINTAAIGTTVTAAFPTAGLVTTYRHTATVTVTTAGTLSFSWAQSNADAVATTVRGGGTLRAERMS
jgi:hypothetical protein